MNPTLSARLVVQSFCFIGVIAVGGCAQPVEPAPPPSARATPPHPVAAAPAAPDTEAGVKTRPLAAKRPGAPSDGQAAALPAQGDLAAPPFKLIGLTQQETISLLGTPSAQWDRPPAKVWRYQGPGCAVDVFFYLDVSRNEFSALRTTVAGPDGAAPPNGQPNGQQCLNRIHDVAQRK